MVQMYLLNTLLPVCSRKKKHQYNANVKKSLQPTQQPSHFLSVCAYALACGVSEWAGMCTQKVELSLHLGTLHDVFVQMISPACRQPNYLSPSVSSEPKRTLTHTHTHRPIHIPQGCLSATLLPHCVMEAITLLLTAVSSLGRLVCS